MIPSGPHGLRHVAEAGQGLERDSSAGMMPSSRVSKLEPRATGLVAWPDR